MADNSITEAQPQQEDSSPSWINGMISLMREIAREEVQKALSEKEDNNGDKR